MNKLKPCPFCGGIEIDTHKYCEKTWLMCRECFIETKPFDTEQEAINFWNTRANDKCPICNGEVERVFAAIHEANENAKSDRSNS